MDVWFEKETVWLTQAQMKALFSRDVSVISRHIKHALSEGEICGLNRQRFEENAAELKQALALIQNERFQPTREPTAAP